METYFEKSYFKLAISVSISFSHSRFAIKLPISVREWLGIQSIKLIGSVRK